MIAAQRDSAAWFGVAAFALAGFAFVLVPLDRARVAASATAAPFSAALRDAGASLADPSPAPVLAGPGASQSATAGLLRDVARSDAAVRFVSLAPETIVQPVGTDDDPPVESSFALGIRASFRDVLAFVSSLSARDELLEVRGVDLQAPGGGAGGAHPDLNATIHVTVYRATSAP